MFGLNSYGRMGSLAFSGSVDQLAAIVALFAGGEQGGIYDASDLASMFQESAGTTPAAVGQPVGKWNDKSGSSRHLTQATSAACPVLQQSGASYYVDFDGTDDFISNSALPYSAARTVLIAGKSNAAAASSNRIYGSQDEQSIYDNSDGWNFYQPGVLIGGASRTTPLVFGFVKDSEVSATTYLGTTAVTSGFDPIDGAAVGIAFAASGAAGANKLACRIYAAIVINRALTTPELSSAVAWLNTKIA